MPWIATDRTDTSEHRAYLALHGYRWIVLEDGKISSRHRLRERAQESANSEYAKALREVVELMPPEGWYGMWWALKAERERNG